MDSLDRFREWLDDNTNYTKATKSNIISRLKRANKIRPIINKSVYLFDLSQESAFQTMTVSVKSQVRRAVKIYFTFIEYEKEGGLGVKK